MRNLRALSTPTWLWFVAFATPAGAAEFDLRPHFEKGVVLSYLTKSSIELHTEVEAAEIDSRVTLHTEARQNFAVTDVDSSGIAQVAWTTDYLVIKSDGVLPGLGIALDYDSREPQRARSPLAAILDPLVGKPLEMRLDKDGHPVDGPNGVPGASDGPLAGLAQSLFMSRAAFSQLPLFVTEGAPHPAKVRSTWSRSMAAALPFGATTLTIEQKFTIPRISPRRKWAHIRMTGRINGGEGLDAAVPCPAPPDCAPKPAPLLIRSGEVSGNYTWDHALGQLVDAETYLKLDASLTSVIGQMDLGVRMNSSVRRLQAKISETPRKTPRPKATDEPVPSPATAP
jgi:hypothetical protein